MNFKIKVLMQFFIFLSFFSWHLTVQAKESSALKVAFNQALQYAQSDRCQKAIDIWQRLWWQYPKVSIANNLAVCYLRMGALTEAENWLDKAVQSEKNQRILWHNIKQLHLAQAQKAYAQVLGKSKFKVQKGKWIDWIISEEEEPLHQKIGQQMRRWLTAWQNQDVLAYLGFYDNQFVPEKGLSFSAWKQQRQRNIESPKYIKIQLRHVKIQKINDQWVWVHALQVYRSDRFKDQGHKAWLWHRTAKGWKIVKELNLPGQL